MSCSCWLHNSVWLWVDFVTLAIWGLLALCVGVWLPRTVKGADAVVLSARVPVFARECVNLCTCCLYVHVHAALHLHIYMIKLPLMSHSKTIYHPAQSPPLCTLTSLQPNSALLLLFPSPSLSLLLSSQVCNLLQGGVIWFTVDLMRKTQRGECLCVRGREREGGSERK